MNNNPQAHTLSIQRHGETYGKHILNHLKNNNTKHYQQKHIKKYLEIKPRHITIGTIWLHKKGYIQRTSGKNSPWELQTQTRLIQRKRDTQKRDTPKKQPRLTRKYLKKQGITGIGLERCLQAIQLGLNKPIQYNKNGGKND